MSKHFDSIWAVYSSHNKASQDFTSKSQAYAECRRLNGTKAGGTKPYHVQRQPKAGKRK